MSEPSYTLQQCVDTLGPHVLHVACAPRGMDVPVEQLVVAGSGDPVPRSAGGVLLLVGARPDSPECAECVNQAGASGYSAVVVKERGHDAAALVESAVEAGVAVLVVPDDMPWRHLDDLMTAAAGSVPTGQPYDSLGIGDLFALANAIAASVGGAITIEDPQGHVLAYSSLPRQRIDERRKQAILGRQTPERPQNADEYRQILQAGGKALRFDFPDPEQGASRLAAAVVAGSEPLGVIFALDSEPPLGPQAPSDLEDAAKVAALHLLRARIHRDPERWARAEALRSLLDGATSAAVAAGHLGILADAPTVVLAIAQTGSDTSPAVANARIVDLVSLHSGTWHPDALCTAGGDVVYALLPADSSDASARRVEKFGRDVVSTLKNSAGLQVCVAIGPVASRLEEVPFSRRVADRVLHVLTHGASALDVAGVEAVRNQVVLLELAERDQRTLDFYPGPVERILRHDADHGTAYADTLLAFLNAFGEASAAAGELMVHENTLRYRIRRLVELFDLALDDPDERLVTWLHLRLTREKPRPPPPA